LQADIHNLETEIKECEAELQKVTKNTSTGNTYLKMECGDSENESDDFVETTPKEKSTSNKTWLVYPVQILSIGLTYRTYKYFIKNATKIGGGGGGGIIIIIIIIITVIVVITCAIMIN